MTFLEQLQQSAGLLSNDIASVGTYNRATQSDFVNNVPQNKFAGNRFLMPSLSLGSGQLSGTMGSGSGTYTPGAFQANYQSQTGTSATPNANPQAGGGGGGGGDGYYGFQGGDVDLSQFDPSALPSLPFPSIFGIVTGLLNDIFSGDATQDEIDAFNAITAANPTASYSALTGLLSEGNFVNTTGLTPIGLQGDVMTTPTGDVFIGNPLTGQGVNPNVSNTTTPQDVGALNPNVFGNVVTNAQGDTFYGGPQSNNQGNQQGGNNQPGAGSSPSGPSMGMGAGGPNYCFDPNTLIQMEDGSEKKIKEVQIGDKTLGGEVTGVVQFKPNDEIHNYKGVIVAGSHFVKEDGKFIPVADSPHSYKVDIIPVVYSLDTTDRRIWINDIEFADFNGDGFAKLFLNNIGADLTGFEQEVLRQVENKLM